MWAETAGFSYPNYFLLFPHLPFIKDLGNVPYQKPLENKNVWQKPLQLEKKFTHLKKKKRKEEVKPGQPESFFFLVKRRTETVIFTI